MRRTAPRQARQNPPPALSVAAAAGLLALVCLLAYWNSFRALFLLDNQTILLEDPRLRTVAWQNLREIFTHDYWWPSLDSNLFRPLTTLSYWFNGAVLGNGADPFGYHLVNLSLHWINAVLVFLLVRAITRRPWMALLTAGVLACHPLTVESVTNVVGRADLLAGMSLLGGLLLYREFQAATGARRVRYLVWLGLTYLAGVFCKESAVTLPALMLLHDIVFGAVWTRVWPAYVSVLPGAVALFGARWSLFRDSPHFGEFASDNPMAIAPLWTGVMTAVKVIGYDIALVVWPAALSSDYSYNQISLFGGTASGQDLHAWLALALVIALAVSAVVAWRRQREIVFFLGFAAITLLPTSNLLLTVGTIMAERFLYVPLIGLAAAAALALSRVATRGAAPDRDWHRLPVGWRVGAVVVLVAFAARTMARNEDWSSTLRLWTASAEAAPNSIKVLRGLALSTMESDPSGRRVDEALAIAGRGVAMLDAHPLPLEHTPAALFVDLAHYHARKADLLAASSPTAVAAERRQALEMLLRAEQIDRAINAKAKASQLSRGVASSQIRDRGLPLIYRDLASAYLAVGDPQRAVTTVTYLQHLQPLSDEAHYTRGLAEGALASFERDRGNMTQALAHLEESAVSLLEAVLLNPRNDAAWQTIAQVYGLLTPETPAVLNANGGASLNMAHPLVPRHLAEAGVRLVQQLDASGLSADAQQWRQRLNGGR